MTPRENLQMNYWQLVESETVSLTGSMVRDMLTGKNPVDRCRLTLLHNLWFYLDIIQQQKEIDLTNGIFDTNYTTLYCINKIKKQLACSGIDNWLLDNLTKLYLTDVVNGEGIGSMIIEGAINPFRVRGDSGRQAGYVSTQVPVNTWISYTQYIININQNQCCTVKPIRQNIFADTIFTTLLPGNYRFVAVVFENLTTNWAQLSMGITPGGVECFGSNGMNPLDLATKGLTTIDVNKVFSITTPVTLYLHHAAMGDAWNGAIFNIEFIFEKL